MEKYIIVSIGAAAGGTFRYWMTSFIHKLFPSTFPYGTLTVNILGSFLLGVIIFYFDDKNLISPSLKLLLTVGFCGGFTTFSTFSIETINLLRDSEISLALLNISANILFCLLGVYLAYIISKIF
ncbi:MAG: fluoride efflux transporter CrcB [Ignavibacteriales bacterium]|nr:MAG: fluoride efflux transporter CrcB [Ignavibacteriales bacterium]